MAELGIAGTLAVGLVGGYVFMDDRHQHRSAAESQSKELRLYLQASEARQIRREIRSLEAEEEERGLAPRERYELRELRDQLKDLDQ